MDETISADNPVAAAVDNQATEPTAQVNGTSATNGQEQTGGSPEEIFKGIDPNRLPPEAKAAYNSMLKDYREKTARLSETIKTEAQKATEAYRSKAELYDSIATQEEFVKQWNEYVQKANQAPQSQQSQQGSDPVLSQMEAKLNEMNQKIQMNELSQVTNAFAEAVDEKGQPLHPDFDQLNSIQIGTAKNGGQAEEFSLLRACVELADGKNPQDKLANGYKAAKALRDQIFEEGKKAGMGRLQAKALNGTNPPSTATGEVLSVTDKKPKNAHEALALARRGLVVSRD